MSESYEHTKLEDIEPNPEKPGSRWELSPSLGIEEFNLNIAVLGTGDRLSQSHFHYHENQREMFYVIDGRCRVETSTDSFDLTTDEAISFPAGKNGAHLLHNPYDDRCKIAAIGWPSDGRFPVHKVKETDELLD